jgi:hypothetical protein
MALDRMLVPPLYQVKPGVTAPIETIGATDKTAYLNIKLAPGATASFAVTPSPI